MANVQTEVTNTKEGVLKKRSNRLHQWNTRYFILQGPKLSYKLKANDSTSRDTYDLVPGCVVTQVTESKSSISSKKVYSFTVLWPQCPKADEKAEEGAGDSDEEKEAVVNEEEAKKARKRQQIAESEANNLKQMKNQTEKQIEQSESRDSNFSFAAKVATVAVGGVVVGGLTAGIGLAPYLTVVGMTAVAGGGALAWQMGRKPEDSRLILACDTMNEALEWRHAIEGQIAIISESNKPSIPPSIDRKVISSILDRTTEEGMWKRVSINEGIRILEHIPPSATVHRSRPKLDWDTVSNYCSNRCYDLVLNHAVLSEFSGSLAFSNVSSRCRRAQTLIFATPINCLLLMMESKFWPKHGSLKVVKEIDDHADVIEIEVISNCQLSGGSKKSVYRKLCFHRFWRLDDDGVYLITLNSAKFDEFPAGIKYNEKGSYLPETQANAFPSIDAIITIAPGVDCSNFDYDVPESLVTCNCQVSTTGNWEKGELVAFMDSFLLDHLLELQDTVLYNKYEVLEPYTFTASTDLPSASGFVSHVPIAQVVSERSGMPNKQASLNSLDFQNSRVNSLNRRGVTTVQPGMEEILAINTDFMDEPATASVVEEGAASASKPKRTMLGYFTGKNKKAAKEAAAAVVTAPPSGDDQSVTSISHKKPPLQRAVSDTGAIPVVATVTGRNASPPAPRQQTSPGSSTRKGGEGLGSKNNSNSSSTTTKGGTTAAPRKSTKAINSEASMLRQQIQITEYELQRLAKSIRKKVINNNLGSKPEKHQVTSAEYNTLQEQQSQLQQKLQKLRLQHVQLTGLTYEQAKSARSTFGRLRALGGGGRKGHNTTNAGGPDSLGHRNEMEGMLENSIVANEHLPSSTHSSPSKEQIKHYFTSDPSRCPRPIHWLTYSKKEKPSLFRLSILKNRVLWTSIYQLLVNGEAEDVLSTVNAVPANQIGSVVAVLLFVAFFMITQCLSSCLSDPFIEWITSLLK